MRIGPSPNLPANLTLALILRDRANPTPAAKASLRTLQATRVAVSRQCGYAPEPIPFTACHRPLGPDHPRELREVAACMTPQRAKRPYHPHHIPDCSLPYNAQKVQKSYDRPPDALEGLVDVYA